MRNFLLLLLTVGLMTSLSAQKGTISGTVSDGSETLIGASITVVGTSTGTITDFDGNYSLSLDAGDYVLEVSYTGYDPIQANVAVTAGGKTTKDFTLSQGVTFDAVVVTGTRSNPRTALQSTVPIDNFKSEEIERQGNGDLTETLRNLVPSYTATPLTGDGAAFVRPTSMRGLPPDELLVLVNSKRRHRSALISHFGAAMNVGAHASDVGQIPSIALKNIEVLRDGAAAQYGSDAIAGVMNFMLKDASEGIEVQTQVGKWFGNDKHENNGGETDYKVAINFGLPLTDKGFINISAEYTMNPELSRGQQHAAAVDVPGALSPAMNWGRPESSGLRTMWNAGIELSDKLEFYSFGNFADTYGNYSFFYRAPGKSGVLEQMPLDPKDPSKGNFCWCDVYPAGFTPRLEGFQTDLSGVVGLKGELGKGFMYDLSTSFGSSRIDYVLNGSLNASWGPYSQSVFRPGDLKQADNNFNLDLSKELADNFNLAAGFEQRRETYTMFVGDDQSWRAGPWSGISQQVNPETGENYGEPGTASNGFAGTNLESAGEFVSDNWAVYLDAEWDISEALLIQAAIRHEDFKLFGTTDNYKVAGRWTVGQRLTLRGAYSTGFRAPTAGQANVTTITTSFDGVTGMQVQEGTVRPTNPLAVSLGGKALVPETSVNISFGLASRLSSSMSLTADVYRVNVDDRIIKTRSLAVEGDPNFSELAFYSNALNTETQGLDVVLSWRNSLTNFSFAYNYNETKVLSQTQVDGKDPVSESTVFNIENNLPKHRVSASLTRSFSDRFSATVRANYYGSTIDERGDREEVDPATLVDLTLNFAASDNLNIVLGGNNIFNVYPTEIATRLSQGMPYPRRTPIGYLGGMTYLRLTYKL